MCWQPPTPKSSLDIIVVEPSGAQDGEGDVVGEVNRISRAALRRQATSKKAKQVGMSDDGGSGSDANGSDDGDADYDAGSPYNVFT